LSFWPLMKRARSEPRKADRFGCVGDGAKPAQRRALVARIVY